MIMWTRISYTNTNTWSLVKMFLWAFKRNNVVFASKLDLSFLINFQPIYWKILPSKLLCNLIWEGRSLNFPTFPHRSHTSPAMAKYFSSLVYRSPFIGGFPLTIFFSTLMASLMDKMLLKCPVTIHEIWNKESPYDCNLNCTRLANWQGNRQISLYWVLLKFWILWILNFF